MTGRPYKVISGITRQTIHCPLLMYNRRMKKRAWAVFLLVALGTACLITGSWKFKQNSFVVPVKLNTGEEATIERESPFCCLGR